MSEIINQKGIWWLPDGEKHTISGILNYNLIEGASLELIGTLPYTDPRKIEIIHGIGSDGKKITLYNCFQTNRCDHKRSGVSSSSIYANLIFVGIHFEHQNDIKFSEISFHCSNLNEWAWMDGFDIDIDDSRKNGIKVEYTLPPPIVANVSAGYEFVFHPIASTPEICIVQNEAIIRQKIYVKIKNKHLQSFEEHFKKIRHMRNFISLGVGKAVGILDIFGTVELNNSENGTTDNFSKIKIYNSILQEYYYRKVVLPPNMLFNLRQIREDFNKILTNWVEKEDLLNEVFNLYFSTIYNPKMYYEQVFLNFIHAIESYHRRTTDNIQIEKNEHKKRVKSIIESVDTEYKDWLQEKLNFSNEPTLRNRLTDIIDESSDFINNIIDSKDFFIKKICDTRNYLTHFDKRLEKKAASGIELVEICSKLKIIIEFNFLLEIGFNKNIANELIIRKNPTTIEFLGL